MAGPSALRGFSTQWRRLRPGRYVAVDCDPSSPALTLSHHLGGHGTPAPFRDDLASGAALKWAASPERDDYVKRAEWVYNDHFDVDGFLTAWVALRPDEALEHREQIIAAATAGDFEEWTGEKAVQFAIMGEWIDDPKFSQIAREATGVKRWDGGEDLYAGVIERLPELLRDPSQMEDLWRRPYDKLLAELDLFSKGKAAVTERPKEHLSMVRVPRQLSVRAVVARAKGDRLLQAIEAGGGYLYQLRYRPYLGYRIVSRATSKVHDVDDVAAELNAHWPTEGEHWKARGWWNRELRLFGPRVGRSRLSKTPPEAAAEAVAAAFQRLDARAS
jgi:hypothetical protein